MKKLYLIGGTMGVGKTATCTELKKILPNCVFLDGDWCWNSDPFIVNEETKKTVTSNIRFLLNNFLKCSAYENVVFCWVMHEQKIIDDIVAKLDLQDCKLYKISLVCEESALISRLQKDVSDGLRDYEIIDKSLNRLSLYRVLDTEIIDNTKLNPKETALLISTLN